jgi:putative acetyltransferase
MALEADREGKSLFTHSSGRLRRRLIPALDPTGRFLEISTDNLGSPEVLALLREHLDSLAPTAPAESRHALDLSGLRGSDVTFWCIWDGQELAGFGALKHLTESHAEVKSMRTAASHLRRGVASMLLQHMFQEAVTRGYSRLSLETGSMKFFEPARRMYASFGFELCAPFGNYKPHPNSVFMAKQLNSVASNPSSKRTREKPRAA